MGMYTSNNAPHEKFIWQANGRRLSVENFDELILPHQKFVPYGIM